MADVTELIAQAWTELLQTQITGKQFEASGETRPGHWLAAKGLLEKAHQLASSVVVDGAQAVATASSPDQPGVLIQVSGEQAAASATTLPGDLAVAVTGARAEARAFGRAIPQQQTIPSVLTMFRGPVLAVGTHRLAPVLVLTPP